MTEVTDATDSLGPVDEGEEFSSFEPDPLQEEPKSVLEGIRRQREAMLAENYVDINIPGYQGLLVCRYVSVDFTVTADISVRVAKPVKKQDERSLAYLNGLIDSIAAHCDEFYAREKPNDDPVPLAKVLGLEEGTKVRYGARLLEAVGQDVPEQISPRLVVKMVFPRNEAIVAHAQALDAWLSTGSAEVDEELLGN